MKYHGKEGRRGEERGKKQTVIAPIRNGKELAKLNCPYFEEQKNCPQVKKSVTGMPKHRSWIAKSGDLSANPLLCHTHSLSIWSANKSNLGQVYLR